MKTYRFEEAEFEWKKDNFKNLLTELNGVVGAMHRNGYEPLDLRFNGNGNKIYVKFRKEVEAA